MTFEFKSYVSSTGRNDVRAVYESGSEALRASMDTAVDHLSAQPRQKWTQPRTWAARLSKQDWPDFYEVRFQSDKLQQRPIGFFGPGENEFTIVIWCTEKGGALLPLSWYKTANARRLEIIEDPTRSEDFYQDEE